ncbi:MAG: potassium-transporting ATPase subunit C [Hyphomicrobiales bacterium]|nr:potassium-transporting ATPase subunit C [Hyphomicrobiales bacterium]
MFRYLQKSVILLGLSVVITCGVYPAILWVVGQTLFPFQANGSIVRDANGNVVGSMLVAQPFTKDEYFQPRPSAASYDATASTSSGYGPSNYVLRDRVARSIGPIATYAAGDKKGQAVASDVEAWFQADTFGGNPHIVSQWADAHNTLAQNWVTADPTHAAYIDEWEKSHDPVVKDWIKANPATPQPKETDLAVVFFKTFSTEHPGTFPSSVTKTGADGKSTTDIEPVNSGSDVQSIFFDMWRTDHPDAQLNDVPGDLVTASASGLDPHITLQNAEFQLDRVAAKWAGDKKREVADVRREIEGILADKATAPWGGLIGEKLINVLEVNLELHKRYGDPA